MSKPAQSLHALLENLIDYAGLFPPAGLDMRQAAANYARYRASEYAWALGRFIVPAQRLGELEQELHQHSGPPWSLSVLLGSSLKEDLERLSQFTSHNSGRAVVDCVELKVSSADEIKRARDLLRGSLITYLEVSLDPDPAPLLKLISALGDRAKVRTGGLTAQAVPAPRQLSGFLALCAEHRVPFKATSGLHHPLRGLHPFTYEPDSPRGLMHGFMNLFLAAALVWHRVPPGDLPALLEDEDPAGFSFDDARGQWRSHLLRTDALRDARFHFAMSFGSCSFEEPMADLRALKLL